MSAAGASPTGGRGYWSPHFLKPGGSTPTPDSRIKRPKSGIFPIFRVFWGRLATLSTIRSPPPQKSVATPLDCRTAAYKLTGKRKDLIWDQVAAALNITREHLAHTQFVTLLWYALWIPKSSLQCRIWVYMSDTALILALSWHPDFQNIGSQRVGSWLDQDYFTIKVCSVGKWDRRRDVTQKNPLRPSEWGFKIGYFPNIYGDFCTFSCFSLETEDQIFRRSNSYRCAMNTYGARPL